MDQKRVRRQSQENVGGKIHLEWKENENTTCQICGV